MTRSPSFSRSSSSTTTTMPPAAISWSASSIRSNGGRSSVTALPGSVGTSVLVGGHLVESRLHVLHEQLELAHHALGRLLRPVVDEHDVLRRQLPPQLHVLVAHLFGRADDPQAGVDHRVHPG